jgi:acyl carrier protein
MSDSAGSGEDPVAGFVLARLHSKAPDVEGEIVPDAFLFRDLGLGSLPLIDLLMAMEEHFGTPLVEVEIDPAGIRTVGDLIGIGRQLVANRKA